MPPQIFGMKKRRSPQGAPSFPIVYATAAFPIVYATAGSVTLCPP